MIDGKPVLGLIPARAGSKRLAHKNRLPLAGKPLITWSIETAREVAEIDQVVVSTDSRDIADIAIAAGAAVPFLRPDELATDTASSEAVALHAVESLGQTDGYLVLLQPTSPLRTADDIRRGLRLCHDRSAQAVVSVMEPEKPGHWMLAIDNRDRCQPVHAKAFRGDGEPPSLCFPNGAVFVVDVAAFISQQTFWPEDILAYRMPRVRSIDIDELADLEQAEALMTGRADGA